MNYGEIKKFDIANGTGVRVSLFVSGCLNHCPGCFQKETWDFDYGKPYTKAVQDEIIKAMAPSFISGLTILGGDPFELSNQKDVAELITRVRRELPLKTIWMYTGYLLDQDLLDGGRRHTEWTDTILNNIDVLVDGPFVEARKDLSLQFCGSSNQRLIDVPASLKAQEVVLYDPSFFKEGEEQ
ncbi:anaerobic ribonucleoside-triphosphate reductase activating protein [Allobaculum mucilyticum]|uniref:anaerobic ribonucleoside-triphosphate reductase activating protein n=1 Tax=Allobaculum mucilyticum TaxID=2834459 RepID=UPI001E4ED165|nr:anaerobic ribonucleoside-triphosphate reductase activating protein [Allobaculum mucilyticum]UNT95080.1 anaerobic ribonucleoside-triphosphate reductase activating protein [Allobaculum mucilyticum]